MTRSLVGGYQLFWRNVGNHLQVYVVSQSMSYLLVYYMCTDSNTNGLTYMILFIFS
jgi:hypothetical protein